MNFINSWRVVPVIVGLYYLLVLFVGLSGSKRVKTVSAHVVANRSLGAFSIFFLGVSEYYSAAALLGIPGWTYQYGAPAYVLLVTPPLLWLFVYWLGPLIWEAGKEWGCLTQAQFFAIRFSSPSLGASAAIIAMVSLVPYIAIQMMASGYIFQVFTDDRVPYWLGSLAIYAIVAIYTFTGGLGSIRRVAILKGFFMLAVVMWLLFRLSSQFSGHMTGIFQQLADDHPAHLTLPGNENFMGYTFWSTTILVGAIGGSMYPHFFINCYSALSAKSIKLQAALSPLYLVLTLALVIIGSGGVLLKSGVTPSDHIIVEMVKAYMPFWVMGIFCAAALAAGTSTASPVLLAVAATLSKDLVAAFWTKPLTDNQIKWLIRYSILVLTFISYVFALMRFSTIVYIAVALLGVSAQFFPLLLLGLYWKRSTSSGACLGLLVGALTTIIFTLGPIRNPFGIHAGLIGLIANFLVFVTADCLAQASSEHKAVDSPRPTLLGLKWKRRTTFILLGALLFLLLSTGPAISLVNRARPFVFGLPLLLFYIISLIAFTTLFMFTAYRKGV